MTLLSQHIIPEVPVSFNSGSGNSATPARLYDTECPDQPGLVTLKWITIASLPKSRSILCDANAAYRPAFRHLLSLLLARSQLL
jgi:hypothetical protein